MNGTDAIFITVQNSKGDLTRFVVKPNKFGVTVYNSAKRDPDLTIIRANRVKAQEAKERIADRDDVEELRAWSYINRWNVEEAVQRC